MKKIYLKPYNTYGLEEEKAALKVIKKKKLSDFLANHGTKFKGGINVKKFEKKCTSLFKTKYAITVNSWTSGLVVAAGAININPGDEVIVTPNTMSATIAAILHWGGIPIFCDIEKNFFNIDPDKISSLITNKTKAIFVVDIYGHPCEYNKIIKIAKKNNLWVVSDNAQSPGAKYKRKYSATIADIGGISLNYHKHIHTGEGGVIFTNNKALYERCCLIRNHAEIVIYEKKRVKNISNLIGHNFRFGEIESAIGCVQIKKLKKSVLRRQVIATKLNRALKKYKWLQMPKVSKNSTHAYYVYPLVIKTNQISISRDDIILLLKKAGIDCVSRGYLPANLLPLFTRKVAFGNKKYPWSLNKKRKYLYKKGICPVAENLYFKELLSFEMCCYQLNDKDLNKLIKAFTNVFNFVDMKHKCK